MTALKGHLRKGKWRNARNASGTFLHVHLRLFEFHKMRSQKLFADRFSWTRVYILFKWVFPIKHPADLPNCLPFLRRTKTNIYIYCTTSLTAYRNWLSCVLQTMQRPLILSESWSRSNTCIPIAQVPLAFVGVADVNVFFFLPCSFFV